MEEQDGQTNDWKHWQDFLELQGVQSSIQMAVLNCWRLLPKDQRDRDGVETQMIRMVKRAVSMMMEDLDQFGLDK